MPLTGRSPSSRRGRPCPFRPECPAGTAIRQSLDLIRAHGAVPVGVLIALDRQERGGSRLSAAREVEAEFGIPVCAIARLDELLTLAAERSELAAQRARLESYRREYGSER